MSRKRRLRGSPRSRRADGEAFVDRARGFHIIAADASSLIVLADIGAREAALSAWRFAAPDTVRREAGAAAAGVASLGAGVASRTPDAALVAAAAAAGLPVLSEDRRVLMNAEEAGLDCFDSLVALELLRGLGALDEAAYQGSRALLLRRNDCRPYRLAWAREVAAAADKLL